jgi:hypothetical protein
MAKITPEQNIALVLEAFDTLFNKRDYETAARFWSPTYIQHSAHIPGSKGAQYIGEHREHGGIMVPHRRRVYPLGPNNESAQETS